MEKNFFHDIKSDFMKNTNNNQIKYNNIFYNYTKYLSNDDYINLFYNSKNNGFNINFQLNVIYNKRKSKSSK